MSRDMNELENACEETAITLASPELRSMVTRLEAFEMCKEAFNEALRPGHMKLTEEVKGLIEALEKIAYESELSSPRHPALEACNFTICAREALEPFEKEGGE